MMENRLANGLVIFLIVPYLMYINGNIHLSMKISYSLKSGY